MKWKNNSSPGKTNMAFKHKTLILVVFLAMWTICWNPSNYNRQTKNASKVEPTPAVV